jgi:heme-degrading monooxygenase HmoA
MVVGGGGFRSFGVLQSMILRIFRAEIFPGMKSEFERDVAAASVRMVMNQEGCLSCQIAQPIHPESTVYALLSLWKDRESLIAFVGADFETANIPAGMGRYIKSCSVENYFSLEPFRRRSPDE